MNKQLITDAANLEAFASWEENKNFADLLRNGATALRKCSRIEEILNDKHTIVAGGHWLLESKIREVLDA